MIVAEPCPKRSRGRPQCRPDAETCQVIAEAAQREFMANGFAGTSMDAVAKRAGVSKKTLYRLIATKADLFKASVAARTGRFLLAGADDERQSLDVMAGLERVLTRFGTQTMTTGAIAFQKLVIAESGRFPELATTFYNDAMQATLAVIEAYLRQQCERGTIALDDPGEAAGMLRGMMIMDPQRDVMMGQRPPPTPDQIAARAKTCAALFLRGCLAEPKTPCYDKQS